MFLHCSSLSDNEKDVIIEGRVLNSCNGQPIENVDVYIKALHSSGDFYEISKKLITDGNGEFSYDASGSIDDVLDGIYIAINCRLSLSVSVVYNMISPNMGFYPIDSLYSKYGVRVGAGYSVNKTIELPLRKRVTILAKPDTLNDPAEFVHIGISESFDGPGTGTYSWSTQFYQDSISILLGAGRTHSISVKFLRNSWQTQSISQEIYVNCEGTTEAIVYY